MKDGGTRALVFLGALIATLLLVLIVILVTDDNGSPTPAFDASALTTVTSAATTTGAAVTTTAPVATTTTAAPTTISAPATTAAATTTAPPTTMAPTYLLPTGYGPIVRGADKDALVASGDLTFDLWDATGPADGYWCGWGSGAGDQEGLVGVQIFGFGIGAIFATDPAVSTPEGITLASSEADVVAALGPPDEQFNGPYDASEQWVYYHLGDNGYRFIFASSGAMSHMQAGDWQKLHLGEGCL